MARGNLASPACTDCFAWWLPIAVLPVQAIIKSATHHDSIVDVLQHIHLQLHAFPAHMVARDPGNPPDIPHIVYHRAKLTITCELPRHINYAWGSIPL